MWPPDLMPCAGSQCAFPRAPSAAGPTSVASEPEASAVRLRSPRRPARQPAGAPPERPAPRRAKAPLEPAPPPALGRSRRSARQAPPPAPSMARGEATATGAWLPSVDRPPQPSLLRGGRRPRGQPPRALERTPVGPAAGLLGPERPLLWRGLRRPGQAREAVSETTTCRGAPSTAPLRPSRRRVRPPAPKVPPGTWRRGSRRAAGAGNWALAPRPAMGVGRRSSHPRPCPALSDGLATTGERGWAVRLLRPAGPVPV